VLDWFRHKREPQSPSVLRQVAGTLRVHSGAVLLGDPMYLPDGLRLENVRAGCHPVVALVLDYPEGGRRVAAIELEFRPGAASAPDKLGEVAVDSACVALLDAQTHEQLWKEDGAARIGVLATPQHRKIATLLKERFSLEFEPVNPIRSELVQAVDQELEKQIIAYLETIPEYAEYPFLHFRVETRNTMEQLQDDLHSQGLWCEHVLDKASGANILAFTSGFGDGCYPAYGIREKGELAKVAVEFIGPAQEKVLAAFPFLRY
jgi:hypothetical protein